MECARNVAIRQAIFARQDDVQVDYPWSSRRSDRFIGA